MEIKRNLSLRDGTGPHPLDVALGACVRLRRKELRISQDELARAVGITFQQIQKYERGTNRISFSRLVEISDALKCSVADLVEGLDRSRPKRTDAKMIANLALPGAMELLTAYAKITQAQRKTLLKLVRQLS
ncbi:MAG TPA: helix-turn-helix transcriptional regulator [Rhizomicrobium sp.]|nr:helix-turn-helix transcriptional regulator [Rhizomicrobium sp.]